MKLQRKLLSTGISLMLVAGFTINANALSNIDKIQGKDRYETAAKIAEKKNYTTVILVNSDKSLADGLSASGLSGAVDAPILLVKKDSIPISTFDKLKGVNNVYIIGGTGSISDSIVNKIKDLGKKVVRIGGNNRIETSYNVAKEINNINPVQKVILTNGFKGEPDAMTVAPVAVRDSVPIILTDGQSIPFNLKNTESYVIGGSSSMSDKLVQATNSTRLGGINRFETNKKIINEFYPNKKEFYIAKAYNLVDALTGSSIAKNMPIVLVNSGSDKTVLKYANKIVALGGIDDNTIQECLNITNNIGNSNTGAKFTVEDAANKLKKLLGVNQFYYDINDCNEGDMIYLVDRNFSHEGKKLFVFGRMYDESEYDFRYCVDQNDMNKVYVYRNDGVIEEYNPHDYN